MACVGPGHAQTRLYGRQVVDAVAQEDRAGEASDGGWGLIGRSQLVHTHLYGTEYWASGCPDREKATAIDQDEPQ